LQGRRDQAGTHAVSVEPDRSSFPNGHREWNRVRDRDLRSRPPFTVTHPPAPSIVARNEMAARGPVT